MDRVRKHIALPEKGPTGRGVRVAVLDTGVDASHPDLGGVDLSASCVTASFARDILDRHGHGTHVAGIIGGRGIAAPAFRGIAPEVELVVIKIATGAGGHEADAAAGVDAAIEAGVDIINYSMGHSPRQAGKGMPPWIWPVERSVIEQAFSVAAEHGILCVVAAGNDGPTEGSINRPGGLECVLTVGAVDFQDMLLPASSRGPYRRSANVTKTAGRRYDAVMDRTLNDLLVIRKPDIVAPGDWIVGPCAAGATFPTRDWMADPTDPSVPYCKISGTSQATAVVSGMAACLLQLARDNRIALGSNAATVVRNLFTRSAVPLKSADPTEAGDGVVYWPNLAQALSDFATDDDFRRVCLDGPGLSLLDG